MAGATVTMILGQKSCPAPTLVVTHSRDDLHAFVGSTVLAYEYTGFQALLHWESLLTGKSYP